MITSDLYSEIRTAAGDFGVYPEGSLLSNSYKYVNEMLDAVIRNALYEFDDYTISGTTITPELTGKTRAAVVYLSAYFLLAPELDGGMIKAGDHTVQMNPKKMQLSMILDNLERFKNDDEIPWASSGSSIWINEQRYLEE